MRSRAERWMVEVDENNGACLIGRDPWIVALDTNAGLPFGSPPQVNASFDVGWVFLKPDLKVLIVADLVAQGVLWPDDPRLVLDSLSDDVAFVDKWSTEYVSLLQSGFSPAACEGFVPQGRVL